jgi:3-phenylpropionate/trans-cinnamate dioxygenase ferredoxin reductase component
VAGSNSREVVIVGGGPAASRCAFELRQRYDFDGAVTVVCAEDVIPYDRTRLSKELLAPQPPEAGLRWLEPYSSYEEHRIQLLCGQSAIGVDTRRSRLNLSGGQELRYDKLVCCTGGTPVLPPRLRSPGVYTLRHLQDVEALREALATCKRLVVVGGGFIGGEIASAAAAWGIGVVLVEALPQPLASVVGNEVGERVANLHRDSGVEVRTGAPVEGVERIDGSLRVGISGSEPIDADGVVVGAGMAPAVEWLKDTPVRLDDGVVTDSQCRTEVDGILAAGDCARWWNPRYQTLMRVEHWDTAGRHGKAAAASVVEDSAGFDPLPFFWSDQHGVKLQWIGHASNSDSVEIEDTDNPNKFVARYSHNGQLTAVLAVGQPRAIAKARQELQAVHSSS